MFLYDAAWSAVDPARNAFDTEGLIPKIVAARTKKGHKRRPMQLTPVERENFLRDLGDRLSVRYGDWTRGWRNSGDEGDGSGGPVRAWCCAGHSWEDDYSALAEKIARSLGQWRTYLEELAGLYEAARGELARVTDDDARAAVASREILKIVGHVVSATGCGDAWYLYAQAAVAWFFEDQGFLPKAAQKGAAAVMEGRFSSWIAPKKSDLSKVSDELGLELAVWIAET